MLQAHSYTLVRHKGPRLTWFFWNIALTGGTEFNILKGKRSYLFRYDNKWKVREKKTKKINLTLGFSEIRFLGRKGHNHSCYANILIFHKPWDLLIKRQTNLW